MNYKYYRDAMITNLGAQVLKSAMSRKDIASQKGVTPETLARHINAKINLTVGDAVEYAKILHCSPQEIIFNIEPIEIIANCHISKSNTITRTFVKEITQQIFLPDYYLDNTYAIRWTIDHAYQGMWQEWDQAIQLILKDPIEQGYVHKQCSENVSICKLKEPFYCEQTNRTLEYTSGFLYPAPGKRYTIWSSATGSSMDNIELEWATPQVQAVFRPDLRGMSIQGEACDHQNACSCDVIDINSKT